MSKIWFCDWRFKEKKNMRLRCWMLIIAFDSCHYIWQLLSLYRPLFFYFFHSINRWIFFYLEVIHMTCFSGYLTVKMFIISRFSRSFQCKKYSHTIEHILAYRNFIDCEWMIEKCFIIFIFVHIYLDATFFWILSSFFHYDKSDKKNVFFR